jgi:hypothetical protein
MPRKARKKARETASTSPTERLERRVAEIKAEIKAGEAELEAFKQREREEGMPEMQELVRYAKRRKHKWMTKKPWSDEDWTEFLFAVLVTERGPQGHFEGTISKRKSQLKQARKDLRRARDGKV